MAVAPFISPRDCHSRGVYSSGAPAGPEPSRRRGAAEGGSGSYIRAGTTLTGGTGRLARMAERSYTRRGRSHSLARLLQIPFPTLRHHARSPATVLRAGRGAGLSPSCAAMDEEAKAGPKPDSNANAADAVEAAAAAPLPPSSSEAAEREAKAEEEGELVERLVELVGEIAAISDFRNSYRRQFCNLSRRIRLLVPMLEEAKEAPTPLPAASEAALRRLRDALHGAGELLRLGSSGSKIFLVGFLALWLGALSPCLCFAA